MGLRFDLLLDQNADRRASLRRSASPRVVPGATSPAAATPHAASGRGEGGQPAALPFISRRGPRLSPYAAYLVALAAICGPTEGAP